MLLVLYIPSLELLVCIGLTPVLCTVLNLSLALDLSLVQNNDFIPKQEITSVVCTYRARNAVHISHMIKYPRPCKDIILQAIK